MRLLVVMGLTMLVGCGGQPTGDVLDTVPAEGVLLHKGQPLAYHQVIFMQDGSRPAAGISDAEGKFVLGTNDAGDGAPAGDYKIAVTYVGPPSTDPNDGINEFKSPPPPKVKIDRKYADSEKSGLTASIPDSGDTELKIELQ